MTLDERILKFLTEVLKTYYVPLACTGVAVLQIVSASAGVLDPWKGGGFGMFSTVDSRRMRPIYAFLETRAGATWLPMYDVVPPKGPEVLSARSYPTAAFLKPLARRIYPLLLNIHAMPGDRAVIRIDVSRIVFTMSTGRVSEEPLSAYREDLWPRR